MQNLTVAGLLERAARLYPNRAATVFAHEVRTFAGFRDDVERLAAYLEDLGLKQGDRVAVLSRNNSNILRILFAAAWKGIVFVPVNFRLTAPEVAFVVEDAEAPVLFADAHFEETAKDATDRIAGFPEDGLIRMTADLCASLPERRVDPVQLTGDDLFGIYYTSGTTGNPKGVMLSHGNMIAGVINHTIAYRLGPDDVCLHLMPLYHTMEASMALCQFFVGGTNIIEDHFDPDGFWKLVERHGVTHVTAVYTMLIGILDALPGNQDTPAPSLRTISLGGQSVPVEVLRRAVDTLGDGRIIQVYGLTEAAPLVTYLPHGDVSVAPDQVHRLASVGKDLYLCQTRVVDTDGNECPPDTLGEVVARGENIMQGYWKRPEETAKTLRNGWLHTGDVGRRDEDGYLYIVDRMKDLIISGGENITPREVEEVLYRHPAVHECSVFGIPDEKWGEAVVAAVSTEGSVTAEELLEHCGRELSRYKLPRHFHFVNDLPKDPVGKIQKRQLRQDYLQTRDNS